MQNPNYIPFRRFLQDQSQLAQRVPPRPERRLPERLPRGATPLPRLRPHLRHRRWVCPERTGHFFVLNSLYHLRLDRGFRFLGAVLVPFDDICNYRTEEERMLSVAKLVRKSRVRKNAQ